MDLSPVTPDAIAITIVYSILILRGVWVGVRQVNQGFHHPEALLNPLFGNRQAIKIFTFHLIIVSLDLFVIGPMAHGYDVVQPPVFETKVRLAGVTSATLTRAAEEGPLFVTATV